MHTRTKRILLCGALLMAGAGVGVFAQEPPPPGDGPAAGMREPGTARPGGGRGGRLEDAMARFKEQLQAENPAEFKRLMELRQTDPEAFRTEIRNRLAQRGGRGEMAGAGARPGVGAGAPAVPPEEKACQDLARAFRETKDPAAAEKVKAELKTAVGLAFDKRLERQQELLTALEERIKTVRDQIQTRQGNKDKICEVRVGELTRDANLDWGPE